MGGRGLNPVHMKLCSQDCGCFHVCCENERAQLLILRLPAGVGGGGGVLAYDGFIMISK